jgi:hypothetical protein
MVRLIEDIRMMLNDGIHANLSSSECAKLLDEIADLMKRFGYQIIDGGE